MDVMKIGVLGSGDIAHRISRALINVKEVELYCVASRHRENAEKLAAEYGYTRVHGTYEDVIADPEVDLVYIGLLHPQHYPYAMKCLEAGKPVLCEKPFTLNLSRARTLVEGFESSGLFLGEALWTRFLPAKQFVDGVLASGQLGRIVLLDVNMVCNIAHLDRMVNPEKGGGALLDLGVYALNFVDMFMGLEGCEMTSLCAKHPSGVDDTDVVTFRHPGGALASCKISMSGCGNPKGVIYGTRGRLEVSDVMNFARAEVYDAEGNLTQTFCLDPNHTGYEYEFLACREALLSGGKELEEMPHRATIGLMQWYDTLCGSWGIRYL